MSKKFGNFILDQINPRGNGIISDILHDDTFRSITGAAGGLVKGVLTGLTGIVKGFGGIVQGLGDGTFIYIIVGGVVVVAGIYAYSSSKK